MVSRLAVVLWVAVGALAVDFYELLKLPRDADDAAIKRSYRKLSRQYHPGACVRRCGPRLPRARVRLRTMAAAAS